MLKISGNINEFVLENLNLKCRLLGNNYICLKFSSWTVALCHGCYQCRNFSIIFIENILT